MAATYPRAPVGIQPHFGNLQSLLPAILACRDRSFVIIKLPSETVACVREVERRMRRFFAASNATKDTYRTPQQGEVVLSHPGYLTPSPGWAELFEVRRSQRDPAYRYPPECEAACCALFDALRALAMQWLQVLSMHLTGDAHCLPSMAARDSGPATMRVIHYDTVRTWKHLVPICLVPMAAWAPTSALEPLPRSGRRARLTASCPSARARAISRGSTDPHGRLPSAHGLDAAHAGAGLVCQRPRRARLCHLAMAAH